MGATRIDRNNRLIKCLCILLLDLLVLAKAETQRGLTTVRKPSDLQLDRASQADDVWEDQKQRAFDLAKSSSSDDDDGVPSLFKGEVRVRGQLKSPAKKEPDDRMSKLRKSDFDEYNSADIPKDKTWHSGKGSSFFSSSSSSSDGLFGPSDPSSSYSSSAEICVGGLCKKSRSSDSKKDYTKLKLSKGKGQSSSKSAFSVKMSLPTDESKSKSKKGKGGKGKGGTLSSSSKKKSKGSSKASAPVFSFSPVGAPVSPVSAPSAPIGFPVFFPTSTSKSMKKTMKSESMSKSRNKGRSKQSKKSPTAMPSIWPSFGPSSRPSSGPSILLSPIAPVYSPTSPVAMMTEAPVDIPTDAPVVAPTNLPSEAPMDPPILPPAITPVMAPVLPPTNPPTEPLTDQPTHTATNPPSESPVQAPITSPPTDQPTDPPVPVATNLPSDPPTDPPVQIPPTDPPVDPPTDAPVPPPTDPPINPSTNAPSQALTMPPTDPPVDPPTDPPVDPPTDPPVDPPTDPPVDPPTDPPVDPPTDPPVDPPTDPPVDPPTDAPVDPPTDPPVQPPTPPPTPPLPTTPAPVFATIAPSPPPFSRMPSTQGPTPLVNIAPIFQAAPARNVTRVHVDMARSFSRARRLEENGRRSIEEDSSSTSRSSRTQGSQDSRRKYALSRRDESSEVEYSITGLTRGQFDRRDREDFFTPFFDLSKGIGGSNFLSRGEDGRRGFSRRRIQENAFFAPFFDDPPEEEMDPNSSVFGIPSSSPTEEPSAGPSDSHSQSPSSAPSATVSSEPSFIPSDEPSLMPSLSPSYTPTSNTAQNSDGINTPSHHHDDAPDRDPDYPRGSPSDDSNESQYTRNVFSEPVALIAYSPHDLHGVKGTIFTVFQAKLSPFLLDEIGSELNEYELSITFLEGSYTVGLKTVAEEPGFVTTRIQVFLVVNLEGDDLDRLLEIDRETVTELLRSFFMGESLNSLLASLAAVGVEIDDIVVHAVPFSEDRADPTDAPNLFFPEVDDSEDKDTGEDDRTSNILFAALLLAGFIFFSLSVLAVERHRRKRRGEPRSAIHGHSTNASTSLGETSDDDDESSCITPRLIAKQSETPKRKDALGQLQHRAMMVAKRHGKIPQAVRNNVRFPDLAARLRVRRSGRDGDMPSMSADSSVSINSFQQLLPPIPHEMDEEDSLSAMYELPPGLGSYDRGGASGSLSMADHPDVRAIVALQPTWSVDVDEPDRSEDSTALVVSPSPSMYSSSAYAMSPSEQDKHDIA